MRQIRNLTKGLLCLCAGWLVAWAFPLGTAAQTLGPAARPVRASTPKIQIDWRRLPSRALAWSHPIYGMEPRLFGDQILVIEPSQRAISALAPRDGVTRWQLAAPAGVTFTEFAGKAPNLLLVSGHMANGTPVLFRISASGKRLWNVELRENDGISYASVGTSFLIKDRRRCQQLLFDGENGKKMTPALSVLGNEIEEFGYRDMPRSIYCETSSHLHLMHRGLAILSEYGKGAHALRAQPAGTGREPRWTLPGRFFRLLRSDSDSAIFYRYDPKSAVLAVRLQTGALIWQRELADACSDDVWPRHVSLVRKAGMATAALLQSCKEAQLIELDSGNLLFTRPTEGALALLAEVDPTDVADGEAGTTTFAPLSRPGPQNIRFFAQDGTSKPGPTLPADLHGFTPVPGGLVLQNSGLDRVEMLRNDGEIAWQVKARFGNSFRLGDYYVLLVSEPEATYQVTIEIATGRAFIASKSSPYVLGRTAAAPELWLTVVDKPAALVALKLTDPVK